MVWFSEEKRDGSVGAGRGDFAREYSPEGPSSEGP